MEKITKKLITIFVENENQIIIEIDFHLLIF
jgi:hypothetical protein